MGDHKSSGSQQGQNQGTQMPGFAAMGMNPGYWTQFQGQAAPEQAVPQAPQPMPQPGPELVAQAWQQMQAMQAQMMAMQQQMAAMQQGQNQSQGHGQGHGQYQPQAMAQGPGQAQGQGINQFMQEIANGGTGLGSLTKMLDFDDKDFWKGALVGAALVMLFTNEGLQNMLFKGAVKGRDAVKDGVDKVKEGVDKVKTKVSSKSRAKKDDATETEE